MPALNTANPPPNGQQPVGNGKAGQLRAGNWGARNKTKASQLCEMQQVLREITLNPETKPADASACARAWDVLEERLRILRGKFRPGDVRASDLDPVRLAWQVKRFTRANKKTMRHLQGLDGAITIAAQVQPAQPPACGPDTPTGGVRQIEDNAPTPQDGQKP